MLLDTLRCVALIPLVAFGACSAVECCANPSNPTCNGDGGGPTLLLTFNSLSTRTLPVALENDGNTKDVKVKDRAAYKPSKGLEAGLARRVRMKSAVDGGAACLASQVDVTGDVSARVRVSVDSTDGLVDGASLAFLERRPVGGPVARLEATWIEGLDGLQIRALVDGMPDGDTLDLPGGREAELIVFDLGPALALQAGAPGEAGATLTSVGQDGGDDTARIAVGAEGLGKKGAFWFAQLRLDFGLDINPGEPETVANGYLALAWLALDDAEFWLGNAQTAQNAHTVLDDLNAAATNLSPGTGAWAVLEQAQGAGSLKPTTNAAKCIAVVKSADGLVVPASVQLLNLLQKGGTSALPVKSHVLKAKRKIEQALALVNGFQSASRSKLDTAIDFGLQ